MASIKYSGLVTDIKGSIGGTTFKGTRQGAVIQNKVTKPPTTANGAKITKADAGRMQRNIATNVFGWKSLDADQRNAWDMAAPSYPFKDKFGNEYTPSGYQLYQSVNSDLLLIEEPTIDIPPTPEAWENCPEFMVHWVPAFNNLALVNLNVPAGYKVTVFMCRPLSSGTKGNVRDFRKIITVDDGDTPPIVALPSYQAVFGACVPSEGSPFYGKITKADAGRGGMIFAGKVQYI